MLQQVNKQNVWGQGEQRKGRVHLNFGSKLLVLNRLKHRELGRNVHRGLKRGKPGYRSKLEILISQEETSGIRSLATPSPTHLSHLEWP